MLLFIFMIEQTTIFREYAQNKVLEMVKLKWRDKVKEWLKRIRLALTKSNIVTIFMVAKFTTIFEGDKKMKLDIFKQGIKDLCLRWLFTLVVQGNIFLGRIVYVK